MKRKYVIEAGLVLLLIFLILGFVGLAHADEPGYRALLKVCGGLAAVLGLVGIAAAGYFAGRDYDSYTGWERYTHGAGMFYNRKPFQREAPTYEKTDQARRLNWEDSLANRMGILRSLVHSGGRRGAGLDPGHGSRESAGTP